VLALRVWGALSYPVGEVPAPWASSVSRWTRAFTDQPLTVGRENPILIVLQQAPTDAGTGRTYRYCKARAVLAVLAA
jgi:hypothetical protein